MNKFWILRKTSPAPTAVLNFGFGSRTTVLNLGLGSPTTVLNFGFGSWTTPLIFWLGNRTTEFNSGFCSAQLRVGKWDYSRNLLEREIKQYKLGRIRQFAKILSKPPFLKNY